MKKYGDDADLFHDQGTRVELSKKWHEQNQLRHDYSYRSPPKPSNRSYNRNKSSYKPDYSKTYYKPKTNQQYRRKQSNYSSNRTKEVNNSDDILEWKICPKCGHKLIKVQKKCPYCKHDFKKIKNDEKTLINYLFDCHDDKINGTRLSKTKVISWIVAIISGILTDIHICLIPNSQGIYAANLIFSFFLFGAIFGLLTYFVGKLVSKILNKVI